MKLSKPSTWTTPQGRRTIAWLLVFTMGVVIGATAQTIIHQKGGDECRLCEQHKAHRYTVCEECFARIPEDPTPGLTEESAERCVALAPDPEEVAREAAVR